MKKILKTIYYIFLILFVRYLLYNVDILKVQYIKYKNNRIYVNNIKKINLVTQKNKFILLEPSFIVLFNELDVDFLFRIFNPYKIFILTQDITIRFYSIKSKEYKMFTNHLMANNQSNIYKVIKNSDNCKIVKEKSQNSYFIYDKKGLFILDGVITDKVVKKFCNSSFPSSQRPETVKELTLP